MKNTAKNFLILILLLVLGIACTIIFVEFNENKDLSKEININKRENDSIQKKLLSKNEELIYLLKINQKEIYSLKGMSTDRNIDGILLGNKSISLEELIDIANKYQNEKNKLQVRVKNDSSTIQYYIKLLNQLEKDKVLKSDKKGTITYTNNIDSLYKMKTLELSKVKVELQAKNTLLNLIKKKYEIDTEIEYGEGIYTAKLLNTKKLDSALWIFPYYKHKIKTNKKGETVIR
ncbi:hypothetical protein [Flavobacterium fluviale]|uniref:Uncharacterized protein n=1 Tax=Flavobacterium fluviale TaxID=2249356 RepID=A0A344LX04_9FLAO|nr:hypothetical protein [Flavobacterium fluviale]AXB58446.1 hypothetical protein HYN86_18355 [Flavobacterium fluviale]